MAEWARRAALVVVFWFVVWSLGSQAVSFLHVTVLPQQSHGENTEQAKPEGPDIQERRIADYTLWLMLFTGVLGGSTILLWAETRRTANLAREEFVASHRPRVIVRSVRKPVMSDHVARAKAGDTEQPRKWVLITIANVGESDAIIFQLDADYWIPRSGAEAWMSSEAEPFGTATIEPTIPINLQGGEQATLTVISATLGSGEVAINEDNVTVAGIIRYTDVNGVVRNTKFTRRWVPSYGEFWASESPAEEYTD